MDVDMATTTHQQSQSLFLRIDRSTRHEIYEHVFRLEGTVTLVRSSFWGLVRPQTILTVLLSCKQMYEEAETVFFSVNRLMVPSEYNYRDFWEHIGRRRAAAVSKWVIQATDLQSVMRHFRALPHVTNISSLHIDHSHYCETEDCYSYNDFAIYGLKIGAKLRHMTGLKEIKIIGLKGTKHREEAARMVAYYRRQIERCSTASSTARPSKTSAWLIHQSDLRLEDYEAGQRPRRHD